MTEENVIIKSYSLPQALVERTTREAAQETAKTGEYVSASKIVTRALELYFSVKMYKTLQDWVNDQPDPNNKEQS